MELLMRDSLLHGWIPPKIPSPKNLQDELLVGIPEAGRSGDLSVLQNIMGFFVFLGKGRSAAKSGRDPCRIECDWICCDVMWCHIWRIWHNIHTILFGKNSYFVNLPSRMYRSRPGIPCPSAYPSNTRHRRLDWRDAPCFLVSPCRRGQLLPSCCRGRHCTAVHPALRRCWWYHLARKILNVSTRVGRSERFAGRSRPCLKRSITLPYLSSTWWMKCGTRNSAWPTSYRYEIPETCSVADINLDLKSVYRVTVVTRLPGGGWQPAAAAGFLPTCCSWAVRQSAQGCWHCAGAFWFWAPSSTCKIWGVRVSFKSIKQIMLSSVDSLFWHC